VKQLRKYSEHNNKIFPKDEAKAGGLLKQLLRLFYPHKQAAKHAGKALQDSFGAMTI
jgi:hypothetical protein